jgi:hypothetical protein
MKDYFSDNIKTLRKMVKVSKLLKDKYFKVLFIKILKWMGVKEMLMVHILDSF